MDYWEAPTAPMKSPVEERGKLGKKTGKYGGREVGNWKGGGVMWGGKRTHIPPPPLVSEICEEVTVAGNCFCCWLSRFVVVKSAPTWVNIGCVRVCVRVMKKQGVVHVTHVLLRQWTPFRGNWHSGSGCISRTSQKPLSWLTTYRVSNFAVMREGGVTGRMESANSWRTHSLSEVPRLLDRSFVTTKSSRAGHVCVFHVSCPVPAMDNVPRQGLPGKHLMSPWCWDGLSKVPRLLCLVIKNVKVITVKLWALDMITFLLPYLVVTWSELLRLQSCLCQLTPADCTSGKLASHVTAQQMTLTNVNRGNLGHDYFFLIPYLTLHDQSWLRSWHLAT